MRGLLAVTTILALIAVSAAGSGEARPLAYEVIVNPANATSAIDRQVLAEAFLKKTTEWSSGSAIQPVDLPPDSPVRRRFTEEVLHRSVSEVKVYWQQRIFSGRDVPPPELDTDEAVVAYVLKYAGAVGYVSGAAALRGAKVVTVR